MNGRMSNMVFEGKKSNIMAKTAKFYGWQVTGTVQSCKLCKLAKAQQKNLNKEQVERSANKGD